MEGTIKEFVMTIKKLLAPILILCLFAGKVAAQSNDRESLRGIGAVSVAIGLNSHAREGGLTEDRLKTTAELGLRRNGIPTGSISTFLIVEVTALEAVIGSGRSLGYAAFIEVRLTGLVTIFRNDVLTDAQIWHKGMLILAREDTLVRDVREIVEEYVDQFSNDYLAVNPK